MKVVFVHRSDTQCSAVVCANSTTKEDTIIRIAFNINVMILEQQHFDLFTDASWIER